MKRPISIRCWCALLLLLAATGARGAELMINEILFNPPGADSTNEYVELRGTPNHVIPAGTYLIALEGDDAGDPGTVQNRFNLSGRRVGQNGFLVLLQKFSRYAVNPLATAVTNSDSGEGWGSGSSSSLEHDGEGGQIELENPSCTFLLIQTTNAPAIGDDVDGNDDGAIDASVLNRWTILDAVGVLDADGSGDIAYGRINFRRDASPGSGATAGGTVVAVPFTTGYVARGTNNSGWAAADWVASDNLLGAAPRWFLGANNPTTRTTNTIPVKRARAALAHIGGPNFGARALPAVLVRESAGSTKVVEGSLRDSYTLGLATAPSGAVTIRIEAEPPLQISLDGVAFTNSRALNLATTVARGVTVRVPDDRLAGPSPRRPRITHTITATGDPARYPMNTVILPVTVSVAENDFVILSEAKVNPPGTADAPYEFVELTGPPGLALTNLWLLSVQGNATSAGLVDLAVSLTGAAFGTNGLLVVTAINSPYAFPPGTAVWRVPQFGRAGGALDNNSVSLLLVGSATGIAEGIDLDAGDNGVLEGLPADAAIMDAVGWTDGGSGDVTYGGVDLTQSGYVPDAASRLRGKTAPFSASSWAVGDLLGTNVASLSFDYVNVTTNLPPGSTLTPGTINRIAPSISALTPISHVIGEPENGVVTFTVSAPPTPAAALTVTAVSTNPLVVPEANLRLSRITGGTWSLTLEPVGVGYSDIIISVHNGTDTGRGVLHYAASAAGRPGGKWHTGISDASTAIPLDANWMLIGDDENQTIRVFSRTRSGPAAKRINLNSGLGLRDLYGDGSPKEVDIEGSFRVGNRIYWLGSHSHSMDLLERTNRARLFATDLSGAGADVSLAVIAHYDFFKIDVLNWDQQNVHGRGANYYGLVNSGAVNVDPKAPDGSGFNFEGLCAAATGGAAAAWVGFRAPLVPPGNRVNALIVPVLNYATLASRGGGPGSAVFGPPIELNLGGRSIRSIEGSGTNYLIVAGPPGAGTNLPPPGNFRLFTWSGRTNEQPRERSADLTGLSPEGLGGVPPLPWTSNSLVQLISDNGAFDFYGDGQQAKHLPIREFKKFRVDTVALGSVVAGAPLLRVIRLEQGAVTLNWFAEEGVTYRVQCNPGLETAGWRDLDGDVLATGPTAEKVLPGAEATQCFFRVVVMSGP